MPCIDFLSTGVYSSTLVVFVMVDIIHLFVLLRNNIKRY